MIADPSLGEIYRLIEEIKRNDLIEIKDKLSMINSRVSKSETRIAILEDRGTRDPVARWAVGIGAGAFAAIEALSVWLKK